MGVVGPALFYIFIYLPIFYLFTLCQRILWRCNGIQEIIRQIEAGQLYERSAHVFNICWKLKKEPFQLLSQNNFIATHSSFEHPNYVLTPNVSLLAVLMDVAIFVEIPEDYDIFDARQSPFIHLGQFEKAYKIITLPIPSFIRLANELGDPALKVIWLHSTGRCGSTALGQVFEVVPKCVTISEPMCLFTHRVDACNKLRTKELRNYLKSTIYLDCQRSAVRLLAKPIASHPEVLLIKNFTLSGVNEVADLELQFPNHIHLFLYRDCLSTVQSYLRSLSSHFLMRFVMAARRYTFTRYVVRSPPLMFKALVAPEMLDANQWLSDPELQLTMTDFALLVIQWALACRMYCNLREKGSKIRAIRYEDLVENRYLTLTELFSYCGISLVHVKDAEKSLETDSQEGTVLSRTQLSKVKKKAITESVTSEANFYLKGFRLPQLCQPCFLPGVLSPLHCGDGSAVKVNHAEICIVIKQ